MANGARVSLPKPSDHVRTLVRDRQSALALCDAIDAADWHAAAALRRRDLVGAIQQLADAKFLLAELTRRDRAR